MEDSIHRGAPSRKPYCSGLRSGPFRERCRMSDCSAITCSSILPASSSRQMGRYPDDESSGFPSLGRRTSLASFHSLGKRPSQRQLVKSRLRRSARAQALLGIPSGPGAELSPDPDDFVPGHPHPFVPPIHRLSNRNGVRAHPPAGKSASTILSTRWGSSFRRAPTVAICSLRPYMVVPKGPDPKSGLIHPRF